MNEWYCHVNGQNYGPYPEDMMREMLSAGQITDDTLLYCAEYANRGWITARDCEIFVRKSDGEKLSARKPNTESMKASMEGRFGRNGALDKDALSSSAYIPPSSRSRFIDYEEKKKYLVNILALGGILGGITGAVFWSVSRSLLAQAVIIQELAFRLCLDELNPLFVRTCIGAIIGLVLNGIFYGKTLHNVDNTDPMDLWYGLGMNLWYGVGCVLPIVGVLVFEIAVIILIAVSRPLTLSAHRDDSNR